MPTAATRCVGDVMTSGPTTVTAGTTLLQLLRLLDRERLDAVPVVDADGRLCGIVTAVDLLRALRPGADLRLPGPRALAARRVEGIMRPGVITLEPTDAIAGVIDLMVETRFHTLPVVKRDRQGPVLVGIVHQRDLLRYALGLMPS